MINILLDFVVSDDRLGEEINDKTKNMNTDIGSSSFNINYKNVVKKLLIDLKFIDIYLTFINETSL